MREPRVPSRSNSFDSEIYLRFLDRCLAADVTVPTIPGIMSVSNCEQIVRFSLTLYSA
ncbi:methylenetetrahydrofolate reductase [Gluconobacter japonicus]|uniref:methylenetetrahydrofolate reductase n=1 Tax=Gluconobacter japonicus TaxID=376620 RepID=UPI0031F6ADD3